KEDDEGGFAAPSSSSIAIPSGPFRLTATGARILAKSADPRVAEALLRADVLAPREHGPEIAALGVTVVARSDGEERRYRLVTAEERALLSSSRDVVSIASPLGKALLGARVGDVREARLPRGACELEIVSLEGEDA
ncbi:MAG TPA: GreA/GreB family elongation factor, partial [Labilithrix sp.]